MAWQALPLAASFLDRHPLQALPWWAGARAAPLFPFLAQSVCGVCGFYYFLEEPAYYESERRLITAPGLVFGPA